MSRSLVETQFGPSAGHYAACAVHASGESLARLLELVAPRACWRALDIATGAGHTAAIFAPHVSEVIATDVTDEMLAETEKLKRARELTNLTTARADASNLPFTATSFDLVTCRLAAHHFPSIAGFIAECARILCPGGVFALVDNIAPDAEFFPTASPAEIEEAARAYNAFEALRDPSHARALTVSEWRRITHQNGLRTRKTELLTKEMSFGAWTERMRCSHDVTTTLRRDLLTDGMLNQFLMPRSVDGELKFSLRELILIADKPT